MAKPSVEHYRFKDYEGYLGKDDEKYKKWLHSKDPEDDYLSKHDFDLSIEPTYVSVLVFDRGQSMNESQCNLLDRILKDTMMFDTVDAIYEPYERLASGTGIAYILIEEINIAREIDHLRKCLLKALEKIFE